MPRPHCARTIATLRSISARPLRFEPLEDRRLLAATDLELLKEINLGAGSSIPSQLTAVGNTLYFSAASNGVKQLLYKSDGTASGTALVKPFSSDGNIPFQF